MLSEREKTRIRNHAINLYHMQPQVVDQLLDLMADLPAQQVMETIRGFFLENQNRKVKDFLAEQKLPEKAEERLKAFAKKTGGEIVEIRKEK